MAYRDMQVTALSLFRKNNTSKFIPLIPLNPKVKANRIDKKRQNM